MKMYHIRGARTFMEIVHVLCNNNDVKILFKFSENFVAAIRFHLKRLLTPLVVEVQNYCRVFFPAFRRSDVFHPIPFPESVRIPKSRNATLLADTGAGKYNKFSHVALFQKSVAL